MLQSCTDVAKFFLFAGASLAVGLLKKNPVSVMARDFLFV
jgi:hypothetical protein